MPKAFFHRLEVHQAIQNIAGWPELTLYVGAGAAVDRTGLTWAKLIDALLSSIVPQAPLRAALLAGYDPMRAASVTCDLFQAHYGTSWRQALHERLRQLLYNPRELMSGRLLESVCRLALAFAARERSVCIITSNFDVFLTETFNTWRTLEHPGSPNPKIFLVQDDETVAVGEALSKPGVTILYLHGQISREGDVTAQPVISERDYHQRTPSATSALTAVLRGRHLLVVGSSLMDPPLVSALHQTVLSPETVTEDDTLKGVGPGRRAALLPLQGSEWDRASRSQVAALHNLTTNRLHQFGLDPIFPDFFFQVGQVLDEIRTNLICTAAETYTDYTCSYRYGNRLNTWWNAWLSKTKADESHQREHHELLREACLEIRRIVGVPRSESLKLEVWLRWFPERYRRLCLWASSVGTWPDVHSMRQDKVTGDSDYRSVRIFCFGSPMFLQAGSHDDTRWRTYLGMPISHGADSRGDFLVGVITLAYERPRDKFRR